MARVLVTESQYERTRATVRAFGGPGGVAHRLQNFLLERQLNEENWTYDWWLSDMYLGNPLPLPINSNPGMVLPPREWKGPHDQARFVARLAACLLKHKEFLDRGDLEVERATSREKGQPMCMSQFYRLLTSCRIPGRPQDQLHTLPNGPLSDEHVIVACKNKFYVLPVKLGGRSIVEAEMALQIQAILQDTSPPVKPVGLLTADRRDIWADTRDQLMQHPVNRQNMTLIERSLALMCLDEPLPPSFNYGSLWHADEGSSPGNARGHILGARDETNMAHEMIHGGGSALNSGNRWFDKTVQLVISSDGAWGLCYEHSPAEGVAVVRLLEQLLDQCRDCSSNKPLPIPRTGLSSPKPLEWYISERIDRSIQEAGRNIDSLLEDLDFYVYRYTGYGKEFIKSCKVSPDAYIQLALQLAYYRLNQKLTATYESASTRRFRLGRVDCIRSASSEARAWADAMCQAEIADVEAEGRRVTFSVADEKRVTLFDAAVARQTQEMVDNILGLGIDIHLLGLRQAAVTLHEPEPEIFQDPTFAKMNHFALSTSQVATKCDGFMGYGPVVPDGYGASYNPKSDSIIFCLSAFHSSDVTSTWQFAHSLKTSLNNMRQLLAARQAA